MRAGKFSGSYNLYMGSRSDQGSLFVSHTSRSARKRFRHSFGFRILQKDIYAAAGRTILEGNTLGGLIAEGNGRIGREIVFCPIFTRPVINPVFVHVYPSCYWTDGSWSVGLHLDVSNSSGLCDDAIATNPTPTPVCA